MATGRLRLLLIIHLIIRITRRTLECFRLRLRRRPLLRRLRTIILVRTAGRQAEGSVKTGELLVVKKSILFLFTLGCSLFFLAAANAATEAEDPVLDLDNLPFGYTQIESPYPLPDGLILVVDEMGEEAWLDVEALTPVQALKEQDVSTMSTMELIQFFETVSGIGVDTKQPRVYQKRRKAPAFRHGDIRRKSHCNSFCFSPLSI